MDCRPGCYEDDPIVAVQEAWQGGDALIGMAVGACVGPLAQRALDEALALAVLFVVYRPARRCP
jgi:hypothetical protein